MTFKLQIYKSISRLIPIKKHWGEYFYWLLIKTFKGELTNNHFKNFYTRHFDLTPDYYAGKKVLDIGCGPRGSLEWAESAVIRVGIDPLVLKFRSLGIEKHKMAYINSGSEFLPFKSNSFDVAASFNSLDHVDDLDKTIDEIKRVIKHGGLFLLICEVNHPPFICEPQYFSWEITDKFKPDFEILQINQYNIVPGGIYQSIRLAESRDHAKPGAGAGIILAKLRKLPV